MKCTDCNNRECITGKDCTDIADELEYTGKDLVSMKASAAIEARYYMKKTRLEEIILYAKEMGYHKLGIAFCIGLAKEAETVARILGQDFDVHSVCCKVCGVDKEDYELEKIHTEQFEATCNPLGQARVLNDCDTDLNLIVGLCIGHDTLFTKHSRAPVTTFIVKDRVLAHNPAGAIYSRYYLKKRFGLEE
ncbi:MAG: DUF1847 domain-containing protein [Methanosarcinaceae archaeon]|nr:DUF1847 domain-containing protein [Methanosarcinaceae archaeon]